MKNSLMPLKEGFNANDYAALTDEPMELDKATDYELNPMEMGDEAIVRLLTDIREQALNMDERLLDCVPFSTCQINTKLFLSRNRRMQQSTMRMTGGMFVMAARGDEIKEYLKTFSTLGGAEGLNQMMEAVPEAVKTVLELLDSEPIVPGEYECICTPEVTGMIG